MKYPFVFVKSNSFSFIVKPNEYIINCVKLNMETKKAIVVVDGLDVLIRVYYRLLSITWQIRSKISSIVPIPFTPRYLPCAL